MSDAHQKLDAIKRLILADLEATSDAELRKELIEDGDCPEKVADGVRVSLETVIQKFRHVPPGGLAADIQSAMRRAFDLGQTYWQQADSESTSQHRKADATKAKFEVLVVETVAALQGRPLTDAECWALRLPDSEARALIPGAPTCRCGGWSPQDIHRGICRQCGKAVPR